MRRALPALLFALSLVLAGCNSFIAPDPAPAPKTTTALSGELAPGLSASGFTDRNKLTDAHDRILREDSYTIRYRLTETARNGSVLGRIRTTHRSGSNDTHFTYSTVQNGTLNHLPTSTDTTSVWSNGTTTLVEMSSDKHTDYIRPTNRDSFGIRESTNRDRLYILLSALNVTHIEKISRTGTPRYRVVANNLVHPDFLASNDSFDSVENASLVAGIDTWGVVHNYRFEATGTRGGKTVHRTETFAVTDIDTTRIQRPAWYATAMNATSRRRSA